MVKTHHAGSLRRAIEGAPRGFFPWIVGDDQAALDLAAALKSEGFLVPASRYPTVAKGSARSRITVRASHTEDQIRALCEAIRKMTKQSQMPK